MPNTLLIYPGDIALEKLEEDLINKEALGFELTSFGLAVLDGKNQNTCILRDLSDSSGTQAGRLSLVGFDFTTDLARQDPELLRLKEHGAKIVGGEILSIGEAR